METFEAILAITDLTKEKATRTVIQKLCYFLKVNKVIDIEFRPHYYGPYSDKVQESLSLLIGLGFTDEVAEKFETPFTQWGWRKYTYAVTNDGKTILDILKSKPESKSEYAKIDEIIDKCRMASDFDLDILAAAAKIHYILDKKGNEMQKSQIREEAKKLGWEIDNESVEKAANLLETLNLARRSA